MHEFCLMIVITVHYNFKRVQIIALSQKTINDHHEYAQLTH